MHATRSPELLRISQVAERLNVSRASVYRWIDEGRLAAIQLGGHGAPIRVGADELDEWIGHRRMPHVAVGDGRAEQVAQLRSSDTTPAARRETSSSRQSSPPAAPAGDEPC
jgi:excisionase family DNA binding protein